MCSNKYQFSKDYFCQLILLFSLLLLLFIGLTTLFGTIHRSCCTISIDFYLYLQYFQQKTFNLSKISRFQIDPKCEFYLVFLSFFFQWVIERFAAASVLVFDKFWIFILNFSVLFLLTIVKFL